MAIDPENIGLRELTLADLPLLLAWRQDAEVRQYMPTGPAEPLWEHQVARWNAIPETSRWMVTLGTLAPDPLPTRPIGETHYDNETGEVGLIIGEKGLWGQGVGGIALRKTMNIVMRKMVDGSLSNQEIWAVIHPDNTRSHRLFVSQGFVYAGPGRNGQGKYVFQGVLP